MKIKKINLDSDGNPKKVTVELTVEQVAFIGKVIGSMNGITSREVMTGGEAISSSIYDGISAGIFNRYYDGGIHEWIDAR